jgi:hypothetical protein
MHEQSSDSVLMKQNFAPKISGYFPIGTYYAQLENLCTKLTLLGTYTSKNVLPNDTAMPFILQ